MVERGSGGAVVNVSSIASKIAIQDFVIYCGTKGAVDQITKVMAYELGSHKVSDMI